MKVCGLMALSCWAGLGEFVKPARNPAKAEVCHDTTPKNVRNTSQTCTACCCCRSYIPLSGPLGSEPGLVGGPQTPRKQTQHPKGSKHYSYDSHFWAQACAIGALALLERRWSYISIHIYNIYKYIQADECDCRATLKASGANGM